MRRMGAVFLSVFAAIIIGTLSCIVPSKLLIVAAVGILYVGVCLVNLKYGLFVTMLIRSSLDILNGYSFQMPFVGEVNLAALLGLWIILMTVFGLAMGKLSLRSSLTPIFLIFLAVSGFSSVINGQLRAGLNTWLKFASLACFYLLVFNYAKVDRRNIARFIDLIIFSAVFPLAMGVLQFAEGTGNHMTEGLNRLNATFVHPNPFAYYLLIVIASCLISIYKRGCGTGMVKLVIRIIILIAAFIELIFTYTRGAWIGLALMMVIIFLGIDDKRKYKFIIPLLICALPFIALIIARFNGVLSSKMEDSSLATRFYIWRNMISLSMQSPIVGHGLGTFAQYAQETINWHIEAHNEYLRAFFETGFIGLAAYLLLQVGTLRHISRHGMRGKNVLHITVFGLFFSFIVMSFADNIFDSMVSQWYLWGLTAMAYAERSWTHESAIGQQILLPEGRERSLLLCTKQNVPGA